MEPDLRPLVPERRHGPLGHGAGGSPTSALEAGRALWARRPRLLAGLGATALLLGTFVLHARQAPIQAPLQAQAAPSFLAAYSDPVASMGARMQYNATTAAAMALLAKLAYCDGKPGIYASAATSCGRTGGAPTACTLADVAVVPGSVRPVVAPGASVLVAELQAFLEGPESPAAYVLAFRGSLDTVAEAARDADMELVPLPGMGLHCSGAAVHAGLYATWQTLKPAIVAELGAVGSHLLCTGHGSGAALCALAMFDLQGLGFQVLSSYVFSMPAPGNAAFARCFDNEFNGVTPLFRITHGADQSCGLPEGYMRVGAEVHYAMEDTGNFSICHEVEENCGCASYSQVPLTSAATCQSSLAPEGSFCAFGSFTGTCYLGQGFQWAAGSKFGQQEPPVPVGLAAIVAMAPPAAHPDAHSGSGLPAPVHGHGDREHGPAALA